MIALLTEEDLDLVELVVDVVVRNAGRPWRSALEQLDDLQRATDRSYLQRFRALVGAVQRVTGGRLRNARIARRARGLVLGHPVFDARERQARLDHAALMLDATPEDVETMLWCDLPRERPIELPHGPPNVLEVAAYANVALLQRAVMRAQALHLRLRASDAGHLARAAAARGLLTTAIALGPDEIILDIAGPLSLFHGTSVYGRALADLVPLLAELRDWTLDIDVVLPLTSYTTRVESPALLPKPPARLVQRRAAVAKLGRALARAAPLLRVITALDLVRAGTQLVWPDLAIEVSGRRIYVDMMSFWTEPFLRARAAAYDAAGASAVLCIDVTRAGQRGGSQRADPSASQRADPSAAQRADQGDDEVRNSLRELHELPARVLTYRKHLDPAALLDRIAALVARGSGAHEDDSRSASRGPKNASSGISISPTPSSSPSPPT